MSLVPEFTLNIHFESYHPSRILSGPLNTQNHQRVPTNSLLRVKPCDTNMKCKKIWGYRVHMCTDVIHHPYPCSSTVAGTCKEARDWVAPHLSKSERESNHASIKLAFKSSALNHPSSWSILTQHTNPHIQPHSGTIVNLTQLQRNTVYLVARLLLNKVENRQSLLI